MIREITIHIALDGTQQITIAKQGDAKPKLQEALQLLSKAYDHMWAEAKKEIPKTTVVKQY
jgi:hypothetical protein